MSIDTPVRSRFRRLMSFRARLICIVTYSAIYSLGIKASGLRLELLGWRVCW